MKKKSHEIINCIYVKFLIWCTMVYQMFITLIALNSSSVHGEAVKYKFWTRRGIKYRNDPGVWLIYSELSRVDAP